MSQSNPLKWPTGQERIADPVRGKFETTLVVAMRNLENELKLMQAEDVVITHNMLLKADGSVSSRQPRIEDTGVAVYFKVDGEQMVIANDKFIDVRENTQALYLIIKALRGLERWGHTNIRKSAFSGFKELPAPMNPEQSWWTVLGCDPDDPWEYIRKCYRNKAAQYHPDTGEGNPHMMSLINRAFDAAKRERKM